MPVDVLVLPTTPHLGVNHAIVTSALPHLLEHGFTELRLPVALLVCVAVPASYPGTVRVSNS